MKKASEYRDHAKECRVLAQQSRNEEQRKQLSAMAENWDNLAEERERLAKNAQSQIEPILKSSA